MLNGKDIVHLSPQGRNLGMVFQNYALFPHMTVLENVMFPLKVRKYSQKECEERARWAIDLVRLRSEEHTSELQSLMRISYAVFCVKKKKKFQAYIYDKITNNTL